MHFQILCRTHDVHLWGSSLRIWWKGVQVHSRLLLHSFDLIHHISVEVVYSIEILLRISASTYLRWFGPHTTRHSTRLRSLWGVCCQLGPPFGDRIESFMAWLWKTYSLLGSLRHSRLPFETLTIWSQICGVIRRGQLCWSIVEIVLHHLRKVTLFWLIEHHWNFLVGCIIVVIIGWHPSALLLIMIYQQRFVFVDLPLTFFLFISSQLF